MTSRRLFSKFLLAAPVLAAMSVPATAQPVPPYPQGYRPPPPLRPERIPPPPGTAFVWAPGHWAWNGYRYRWTGGRYVRRGPGWHHWVDGHWAVIGGAWRWVPGHWN